MKRYLNKHPFEFAHKKIILITGPRQVGKTTYSKSLDENYAYYNYDNEDDYDVFLKQHWDRNKSTAIFDELHKKKNWKLWLKGIYDRGDLKAQKIIVTGSARLDIAKKMGDSLAGRFFSYRLYPFDLKELKGFQSAEKNYQQLLKFGGFPEPFLQDSKKFYTQWKRTHTDLILRQDLLSLEVVKDIGSLELLIDLLSRQVGSTVSYISLARDLQKDEKTIKSWLKHLENLFIIFPLHPYSKNVNKAIKKASKYYFYDIARLKGNSLDPAQLEGAKLENLVALSLKKYCDFMQDCHGENREIAFVKSRDQKEVDFLILEDDQPQSLIEVKLGQNDIDSSLRFVAKYFPSDLRKIQLVKKIKKEYSSPDGIEVFRSSLVFRKIINLIFRS